MNPQTPSTPRLVVLVPPLLVPSPIMWPMALVLRRAGFRTRVFRYASYRRDIPENAARFAAYLRSLGEESVDIVAFSLGSILTRWAALHHPIPQLGRVVFMGPPNRGAFAADWLWRKFGFGFPLVWGRCAMQLRRGDRGLCERAGNLPAGTQLGIIAGGRGTAKGYNPLIPGDNDATVAVQETILGGMEDFAMVRSTHTAIMLRPEPLGLARRFIETGRFRPAERPVAPRLPQQQAKPAPANVPTPSVGPAPQ